MSNLEKRGLWTNREKDIKELTAMIAGKLNNMYLAELLMVADFVEGIEMARNFSNRQNSTAI